MRQRSWLGIVLVLGTACAAAAGDWPQFLGPTRDGVSPEKGLPQTWPKQGPPLLWEKEVGEGYAGPAVAGGRLILFHRVGGEEVIECLDAASGKSQWKASYATDYQDAYGKGDGPRATPVIASERVYTLGAGGVLRCTELKSGTKVWERSLNKDYKVRQAFFGVATTPLVEGNLVIVNVGGKGAGVVALNRNDGAEVWKATDHAASYSSPVAATIDGVRHVICFTREGVVALDPADGALRFGKRWRSRQEASVNAAVPLVVGDQVFVSASYQTGALLLRCKKDGAEEVWSNDTSLSCHFNTPVVRDGFLYGVDGRQEETPRLRCVEWKTGKVRWTKEGFGCAALIAAGGDLLALTEAGDLVLIEATPDAFREKARAALLAGPCRAHPALAGGRLFARDNKKLACWDLKK